MTPDEKARLLHKVACADLIDFVQMLFADNEKTWPLTKQEKERWLGHFTDLARDALALERD
jgi:hypothetical protein